MILGAAYFEKTDADVVSDIYMRNSRCTSKGERNYIWATGRTARMEARRADLFHLPQIFTWRKLAKVAYEKSTDAVEITLSRLLSMWVNYILETHPEVTPQVITHYDHWMLNVFSWSWVRFGWSDYRRLDSTEMSGLKHLWENKALALNELWKVESSRS